jgi:PAS domain-containing protein
MNKKGSPALATCALKPVVRAAALSIARMRAHQRDSLMPNSLLPTQESFESNSHAAANLAALIESTEDLIWSVDLNFMLLTFNSAFQRHIASTFGGQIAIGERCEDLLTPARAAIWPPLYERALSQGPFRIELPFSGGRTMEMAFNRIAVQGRTTGVSVFGKDITARNRAEIELRENADHLTQTQRIGGLGSYDLDLRSEVWTGSDVLHELLGIDTDFEHTLESWLSLIHPGDRAMMEDHFINEVVGKRRTFDKEYRLNRPNDQEERWLHALGQVEFSEQGQPLKMRGVIKDITERKLADIRLRESAESLNEAQVIGGLGSYVMDLATTLWTSSGLMDEIFGIDADYRRMLAGWTALLHPDERDGVNKYFIEEILGKGRNFDREYRIIRTSDHEERWIHGLDLPTSP